MARKTIDRELMLREFNAKLRNPKVSQKEKELLTVLLDTILLRAGDYRGYAYLSPAEMDEGGKEVRFEEYSRRYE